MRFNLEKATDIYCDNKSVIAMSKNSTHHGKAKHMKFKFHVVRRLRKMKKPVSSIAIRRVRLQISSQKLFLKSDLNI